MKKIRAAVVIAAATAGWQKAKDYARENPQQANDTIEKVEGFVRGKASPQYAAKVDSGGAALRRGLGLPARSASAAPASAPVADGSPGEIRDDTATGPREAAPGIDPSI
ncbi:antitoxin [Phycicoccus flavus]|uniref:Antitoxin n=1 Tax=Phycicoccus flavus TaxID=2502783 RepID=A0A8T6QZX5_9MICO|nr:antitoxin [Phycicoccus flavus]NHA66730.1 antitoxin [Phycicoccus flavus]